MSYWDFFQHYFAPMLREIDIIIKSLGDEDVISTAEAAKALALTAQFVQEIMDQNNIQHIDQNSILQIAMHGNSPLCRLLQRQCMCDTLEMYNPEHIAYIYGLQYENVAVACRAAGYTDVPAQNLQDILSNIFIFIMYPPH